MTNKDPDTDPEIVPQNGKVYVPESRKATPHHTPIFNPVREAPEMDYTAQMLGKSYSRGPLLEWGDMLPQMEVNKNAMKQFGGMGLVVPGGA